MIIFKKNQENDIISTVEFLGNSLMRENSHGFHKYGEISIIDAANKDLLNRKNRKKMLL